MEEWSTSPRGIVKEVLLCECLTHQRRLIGGVDLHLWFPPHPHSSVKPQCLAHGERQPEQEHHEDHQGRPSVWGRGTHAETRVGVERWDGFAAAGSPGSLFLDVVVVRWGVCGRFWSRRARTIRLGGEKFVLWWHYMFRCVVKKKEVK